MITRRRGSRALVALVAAIAALVLGACGAAPGINGGAGGSGIRTVNPYGNDDPAAGPPQRGGVLRMGEDREIVSFDPTVQNTNMAATAVYDTLLRLTPQGTPEPYLARSMDTPDGGVTWRMGLRPEVRFSDGTPLDANAVIVNTQRHIDKVASPAHRTALQIASMRAVDPTTVEFRLKAPSTVFPAAFALGQVYGTLGMIVSPAALQRLGDQIGRQPVGAGPFVLTSWVRDSRLQMSRNPTYWQQGLPRLDGLEFRPLPDTESRYASIENRDVDMIFAGYQTELIRAQANPNLQVFYGPGNGAEFILFNQRRAPFDDRRMREAVVRGLDLDALAATQFRGQMARADGWFNETTPYSTPESRAAWPTFDPQRARALVDSYRAGGGPTNLTFKTSNAPNRVAFAEFLQAQMATIGITVTPQFYDLAQFSSSVVQSRDFQFASWVGGPSDGTFPGTGNYLSSQGNANYGGYANPQVDQALATAESTTDDAARTRAYQQVQQLTNQDIAVGYYSRGYLSTIATPRVKGLYRYVTRDSYFADVWLQP